jgi:hypothetical protein
MRKLPLLSAAVALCITRLVRRSWLTLCCVFFNASSFSQFFSLSLLSKVTLHSKALPCRCNTLITPRLTCLSYCASFRKRRDWSHSWVTVSQVVADFGQDIAQTGEYEVAVNIDLTDGYEFEVDLPLLDGVPGAPAAVIRMHE